MKPFTIKGPDFPVTEKLKMMLDAGATIFEGTFKVKCINDQPKKMFVEPYGEIDVTIGERYKKHQEYTFPYKALTVGRHHDLAGDNYLSDEGKWVGCEFFEELHADCHLYDPDEFSNSPL